jgi:hypothetical protein
VYGISVEAEEKNCQNRFIRIVDWLVKNPQITTVALSFFGNYFLDTSYAADHLVNKIDLASVKITDPSQISKNRSEIFFSGLERAIRILEKGGKNVILSIDVPELPFLPRDCYRIPLKNCSIPLSEVKMRQFQFRSLVAQLKKKHPKLKVFDPLKIFCKNDLCSYRDDKKMFYRDSHHLSSYGSDLYGKHFLEVLNQHKK